MTVLHVLHLLWTLQVVTSQEWPIQRSCEPCRCSLQSMCSFGTVKYVDCSRLDLQNIPTNLPNDLDVLDLSYNQIDKSAINSVCNFEFLQFLSLAYNPFTSIDRSAFVKCSLLIELVFTGSKVVRLNSGSFVGLDNVREIYGLKSGFTENGVFEHLISLKSLEFTFIGSAIPEGIFTGLHVEVLSLTLYNVTQVPRRLLEFGHKTLQVLNLRGPEVTYVHEEFLRGLIVLKHVSLELPALASLPERLFRKLGSATSNDDPQGLHKIVLKGMGRLPRNVFNNMEGVISLDIHDVQEIAVNALFDDLVNLEVLNISGCSVVTIPGRWFAKLYSLKTLDISRTNLRTLEEATFRGLINLRDLNLSSNGLRILPQKTFEPLSKFIRTLHIKGNMLKTLDDGVLSMFSLQYLDLSDNKLSKISPNAFVDLKLLTNLQLQENKLYFLPKNLLRNQHKLQILHLGNNHFTHVPLDGGSLTNFLRFLYLSNNKITTVLPFLHSSLPYLKYFALKNNPIYCQCQIFSLRLHRRNLFIDAYCESPRRYFRKHLMYIAIPAQCPGPRPNPGETPQINSKIAPPHLLKSDDHYDYYESDDDDVDYDDSRISQTGRGTVANDGINLRPSPTLPADGSLPRKGCHLIQLLGSFTVRVKPEEPLHTSVTTPLPTAATSRGIITSSRGRQQNVRGELESEALTSTPVLHVPSIDTPHGQRIPGSDPPKVIDELKTSNEKTKDTLDPDVMQEMNLQLGTIIFLPVLVLGCLAGVGVWWKVRGAKQSSYDVNSQSIVSVRCSTNVNSMVSVGCSTDVNSQSKVSVGCSTDVSRDIVNASRCSQLEADVHVDTADSCDGD